MKRNPLSYLQPYITFFLKTFLQYTGTLIITAYHFKISWEISPIYGADSWNPSYWVFHLIFYYFFKLHRKNVLFHWDKKGFFLIKKKTTQSVLTVMIFFAAIEKLKMISISKRYFNMYMYRWQRM